MFTYYPACIGSRNFAQTLHQGISMRFTEDLVQRLRKHFSHLHSYEMVLRHIRREKKELTGALGAF